VNLPPPALAELGPGSPPSRPSPEGRSPPPCHSPLGAEAPRSSQESAAEKEKPDERREGERSERRVGGRGRDNHIHARGAHHDGGSTGTFSGHGRL